ncbi:MAG: hypothetical protein ACLUHK_05530 [Eubacteriales bacterium]
MIVKSRQNGEHDERTRARRGENMTTSMSRLQKKIFLYGEAKAAMNFPAASGKTAGRPRTRKQAPR